MNYLYKTLLVLVACLYLSSCKIMYKPNMQNVPLMKEQGEVRANLNFNNAQVAYAITDNIGIMANGYWGGSRWTAGGMWSAYEEIYRTRRFLAEGALGYFREIGDDFHFEIYGGGGYGGVSFSHSFSFMGEDDFQSRYSANMVRAFIQPAIGYQHEIVDVIFSTRIVGLNFMNVDTINYSREALRMEGLDNLHRATYIFVEPAFTVRVGYKYAKFHFQVMYSAKMNPDPLNYRALGVNMGAHINIARRWKNQ
ncbi:MAG: hypothetical protein ACK4ND_09485 [Cytophagaceae bacterium]